MLKAIETVYHGYRFRSRLEARWAVFFDALGIKWEYEKEGFDLGPAGKYLPDFWLPDVNGGSWIEIKADTPSHSEEEKASALATATGHKAYVFFGEVWLPDEQGIDGAYVHYPIASIKECPWAADGNGGYSCVCPPDCTEHASKLEGGWDNYQQWCECPQCRCVGIQFEARNERLCRCFPGDYHTYESPRIKAAFVAARQARFEHNERQRITSPASDWSRRLNGWATKVYGEDWADSPGYEAADEAFTRWLDR